MKRFIFNTFVLFGLAASAGAESVVDGVSVDGFKMERDGRYMTVGMTIDLTELKVSGNRAVSITPCLINGTDSLELPSVGIYGRRRYYHYLRNGDSMLTGADEKSFKASQKPGHVTYNEVLPYEDWMNGASMKINRREWGCCNKMLAQQAGLLGSRYEEAKTDIVAFIPELLYVSPQAEKVKTRSLEGSAFIDFPVNKTEIYPDYRRNTTELEKIRATIDSVRDDRDVTITSVWLKGYASPESPYAHNEKLAIGRTEALKKYIQRMYAFGEGVISTDHEAEDWVGLRRYVEQSNIAHRSEVLALIDSDREPDNKEWKIKSEYPEDYRYLLQNCYPALRHTDYRIAYTVRAYGDVDEIKRVMMSQPHKLGLNEFYLVAQQYEPGSDEFAGVFETAVRVFPDDEVANLNAANVAMSRGDNALASRYLAKAGNSPESIYARGALAILTEDYGAARRFLSEAKALGVEQASVALDYLDRSGR